VATAQRTTDHKEIRRWVEGRGGNPAVVEGTGGVLRIDFGEPEEGLEHVDWNRFFDIFDSRNLAFLYDPEGYMVKFVEGGGRAAARNGRRKQSSSAGRKKSSSRGRKKSSSAGRKKSSSAGRKKSSSTGRKKSSSGGRKYGAKAGRKVERAMHEMKHGELKSGRSGKKVKNRKQAIAIGLSEARRSGGKVPPNPNRKKSGRKRG
jgi:hypothetical protein